MILKLKISCNLIAREHFHIQLEKGFPKTCGFCIKTTMLDHVNPKNSTSHGFPYWGVPPPLPAKNLLIPPCTPPPLHHHHQEKLPPLHFSWLYHFFILKKPKICIKFHKNSISCFLEKVVLINWLTGWQWCFHKASFCLKTRVQQHN